MWRALVFFENNGLLLAPTLQGAGGAATSRKLSFTNLYSYHMLDQTRQIDAATSKQTAKETRCLHETETRQVLRGGKGSGG
jgi:hypothetical protein